MLSKQALNDKQIQHLLNVMAAQQRAIDLLRGAIKLSPEHEARFNKCLGEASAELRQAAIAADDPTLS